MSATSTVGRFILLSSFGDLASCRVPKWEELRWGYSRPASDVGIDGDRSSSIPNRRDRVEPGSSSDRYHVPTGVSPKRVDYVLRDIVGTMYPSRLCRVMKDQIQAGCAITGRRVNKVRS